MWITDEDEGGFSLGERKPSELQDGVFSTDVYGADFLHQRLAERGSRPAKRARLLSSNSDGGLIQEAQVSRKGSAQGNGGVGGKSQAESRITNGVRSRSAEGMKVTAHEKRGLLKYGNTMQQDADDDSVSTSGDESFFVVQVRSPASKQLLHGRKRSIDQFDANNKPHDDGSICNGARNPVVTNFLKSGVQTEAKTRPDYVYRKRQSAVTRKLDGALEFSTAKAPSNGPDEQMRTLCARDVARIALYNSNQLHSGLIRNAMKVVETADIGNAEEDVASISRQEDRGATSNAAKESSAKEASAVGFGVETTTSEVVNVYVRKRKRSNASEVAPAAVEQSKTDDPSGEREIKHYVRRSHRQPDSHIPADVIIEKPSTESPGAERTSANLHVFQRRPKKISLPQHGESSARIETEGNLNVFHRRPKKDLPLQAEHHPDVPAEGNVNVFQRRSKMKEPNGDDIVKEGHNNHSPVGYVRADHQPSWLPEGWTLEVRQGDATARSKDKYYHDHKSGHIFRSKSEVLQFLEGGGVVGMKVPLQYKKRPPTTPSTHSGFQTPLPKPSQPGLTSPSSQFMNSQPARMKTTPIGPTSAVPSEANGTSITKAPSDPVWFPRDGAERCQGDRPANDSRLQLPTESPVKSPSEQADTENRGKLIFRLKRKHPDSGGKGRSKRPMYEVVHVGKASSSTTSTPTKQEDKKVAEAAPPAPVDERVSSDVSPSVVVVPDSTMTMKAQVVKPTPLENACPSPVVIEQQKPGLDWGIHHHHFEHQEPYTALGIPATVRSSGLKSYSTNHTHVFLDPVTNTMPLSWQYPFTIHASTPVTTSTGPYPSSTAPAPVFEHFQGVSLNAATATVVPCSDSGVDGWKRDSAAAKVASKSLTKEGHAKVLLALGRRVCLAGVEQNKRTLAMQTPEGKRSL